MSNYLWLIPTLPLLASIAITFLGPRFLKERSHLLCVGACALSCILCIITLYQVVQAENHELAGFSYTWFKAADVDVSIGFRADRLNAIMLVTVTFIGSLIATYAAGYMHGDPGYPRFFAEVSLFIFSMTGLVLADNFILLYAFWEGVGLCSYLLVGFWFQKPSAALAARKAFLVTRVGDVGLLLGILLIWSKFGLGFNQDFTPLHSVDYKTIFTAASDPRFNDGGWMVVACLLLFCGAVGKSAQFPLHVWLPDAMEGPTPVSALIHAATMVTAGVYLVARCTPLFILAPEAQFVVACIGGFTALLAALIALTQNDLKRVLAYSTISQLGYMFLALGCALSLDMEGHKLSKLATFAVVAAMFHLFTHAFFKALLFLGAGSVMHAMGGVIDMRRFGGLRYALPTTHWTFLVGSLALAGFPLLSGFWSKDEILVSAFGASQVQNSPAWMNTAYAILFVVAIVTAGLTAFYTFRSYFLTFWGELRIPHEAGHHAHESPSVMTVPLMVLAAGAIVVGFLNAGVLHIHQFSHVLEPVPFTEGLEGEPVSYGTQWLIMLGGTVFGLGGIGLAYWLYVLQPGVAGRFAAGIQGLYQLSLNKFYLDELYTFFIVQPVLGISKVSALLDRYVVDGLVDLVGQMPMIFGNLFRPIQNGLTQFYALAMALGVMVFLTALAWSFVW